MNEKILLISFVILTFFLISAVSAANDENETLSAVHIEDESHVDKNVELNEKLSVSKETAKKSKQKVKLKASNVKMYYKDGTKFEVKLLNKNSKAIKNEKLKITVDGKTHTKKTNSKGKASLSLKLNSGKYKIRVKFDGTDKYKSKSIKKTVKVKSTVKCSDMSKLYKKSYKYSATFYNKKGKVLKNKKVSFTTYGSTAKAYTNSKGVASITMLFSQGTHNLTSNNLQTGEKVKKTIKIKPLITDNKDQCKYYGNTAPYKVKIINSDGKAVGSGKSVTFNINGKNYKKTTDKKGYAGINPDLMPGNYTVNAIYSKTYVTNKITIKNPLVTSDIKINAEEDAEFKAALLDANGNPAKDYGIKFTVDGNTYTQKTNSKGIASLKLDLTKGVYQITTSYAKLKNTNKITVNSTVKPTPFVHTTLIPTYVNVTLPYVFNNSAYVLKSGLDGIITMPKLDLYTVVTGEKTYYFSTYYIDGLNSMLLGSGSYLVPFDGGEVKKDNLSGNGILITANGANVEINYVSSTAQNTQLFGFYASKGLDTTETLTYMENNQIKAKVNIQTMSYDELGLRYNLATFYGKDMYCLNYISYEEFTNNNQETIKFVNDNKPVKFTFFGNYIAGGSISKEYILTKFKVNGREEVEKTESISYGQDENYRQTMGFEVLQSYAIINEKITKSKVQSWLFDSYNYVNRFGVMNVYGMFLTGLETAFLADTFANNISQSYNVNWKRGHTLTILGGMNLNNTYIHVLNADMGMDVTGDNDLQFRLVNSINLVNFENYALNSFSNVFSENTTNSLEEFKSALNDSYIIEFNGDLMCIHSNGNSSLILNYSSGVVNMIMEEDGFVYKGATIKTPCDCCSPAKSPSDVIIQFKNTLNNINKAIGSALDNILPLTQIITQASTFIAGKILPHVSLAAASVSGLLSTMIWAQNIGSNVKEKFIDKKDWYKTMDTAIFTRPGLLQSKKVYNVPNDKGGYDYIEVPLKKDGKLDRDNALYISEGKVKTLTKSETYRYFDEETWTPYATSKKYWDKSWNV